MATVGRWSDGVRHRATVTGIRPQFHFRRTPSGLNAWEVKRLIELSADFKIKQIDPRKIAELRENHWYFVGDSKPTPLSIIEHATLIEEADLSFPVILDCSGRVMDGMHRICKAVMKGINKVDAVQFTNDPPPDYENCDPSTLDYDA